MSSAGGVASVDGGDRWFGDATVADIVWMIQTRHHDPGPSIDDTGVVRPRPCSMAECQLPSTHQIAMADVVVDLTAAEPVLLCSDHAFDHLAAVSWSQLGD